MKISPALQLVMKAAANATVRKALNLDVPQPLQKCTADSQKRGKPKRNNVSAGLA